MRYEATKLKEHSTHFRMQIDNMIHYTNLHVSDGITFKCCAATH